MNVEWNEKKNFNSLMKNYLELDKTLKNLMNFSQDYSIIFKKFIDNINELYNKYLNAYSKQKNYYSKIIKSVNKIIYTQIEGLKPLIQGLNNSINMTKDFIFEKENIISKINNQVNNSISDLEEKYKEVQKYRNNFEQIASEAEDSVYNYYKAKKNNLDDSKENKINNHKEININKNNNSNDNNIEINNFLLIDNNNNNDVLKNNNINNNKNNKNMINENNNNEINIELLEKMKNYEKLYKRSVNTALKYEENLLTTLNISNSNLITICEEYLEFLKNNSTEYLVHYKSFCSLIESELNNYLPFLSNYNINEEFDKIIREGASRCFPFEKIKLKPYKLKIINKNSFSNDLYKKKNELNVKDIFKIVKKLYEYLSLRDENYNLEIEEEKIIVNNITNKILSFSNNKLSLPEETEEELNTINKLIQRKENRQIFISKINEFRNLGIFLIPEKQFNEIGNIMYNILNYILKDNDLACVKNVMILSQTYYIIENEKKKYLQNIIQKNPIFQSLDFWKQFIQFSIDNEIKESLKKDKSKGVFIFENEEEKDIRINNIIFSQLVPLANNMIEFGLDKNTIKSLLQEKFEIYRINENNRKIVMEVIDG